MHTNLMDTKTGQFFTTGFMATSAWWCVWPFEFVKNQIQGETRKDQFGKTFGEKMRNIVKIHGVKGVYRGVLPGSISTFTRNGAGMVIMLAA
jgi:solute carrier family 25 (mitochondrial carnitine/acylcarnitine transporter), member 20/29